MRRSAGFSLLELMVAVAIIAIVSSIAIQFYTGYIENATTGVLAQNIDTMRVFQEDQRLRTGTYGEGTYDVDGGDTSLSAAIGGWAPDDPDAGIVYVVDADGANGYNVTATHPDGTVLCREFGTSPACP
jgi:prepilin-type N-terminal cleavage/methylation domain-containing protein